MAASGMLSLSMRGEASNLPKDRSPHHHVIYAQRARNKWGQSGCSSDLRPTTSAASRKKRFGTRRASERGVLRRMYGKDDRILYSAKFSQGFRVVAAKRTWQAAGVSGGGTKIRVRQGAETQ